MSRRRRERLPAVAAAPTPFPWPWAIFGVALAIRLLYWRATADSAWPHSAAFKGDALLWLEYARALREGQPFELGLPIHPPGTAYLVAALWSGSGGFGLLKAVWCALGAAAALSAAAMARAFGPTVGAMAGVVMAGSSGLLMLSSSLNGEIPYLALVAAGFWLLPGVEDVPSSRRLAAWAALHCAHGVRPARGPLGDAVRRGHHDRPRRDRIGLADCPTCGRGRRSRGRVEEAGPLLLAVLPGDQGRGGGGVLRALVAGADRGTP